MRLLEGSTPDRFGVESSDALNDDAVPHWTLDRAVTHRESRALLWGEDPVERRCWTTKLMRAARYADAWAYLDADVAVVSPFAELAPMLVRRRPLWEWLIAPWRAQRFVDA